MLLKFAIKDFLEDREYKNLSPQTIKSYAIELNAFHEYCSSHQIIDMKDIKAPFITKYLIHCQKERGNNTTKRNTKLRNIKSFFNYLEEIEAIEDNPRRICNS